MSKRNPRQAIRRGAPEYGFGAGGIQGERNLVAQVRGGDAGGLLNEAF